MIQTITIDNKRFNVELIRSRRRSISARLRRDGVVEVKAPLLFRENDMISFLTRHRRWLLRHYNNMQSTDNQQKKFVSGEIHYYLGKQYVLKLVNSDENSVYIEDNYLVTNVKSPELVENQLNKWYKSQSQTVFSELLAPIIEKFGKYNVAPAKVSIRNMRSRWGSCSRRGNISLNMQLIKLQENCIRQVIIHEMCHLVYFNHQKEFYALMTEMMPDWKRWKKELKFL